MDFQKDLAKIKAAIAKRTSTEEGYRGFLAVIFFAVGYFGIISQLSTRLEEARDLHEKTKTTAQYVDDIRHFEGQGKIYADRMTPPDDTAEWGQYIMDELDESGVAMKRFSPDKPTGIGNYKVLKFEVAATGEYFELIDFMDRLERGSRYVRIDEFEIQAEQSVLSLRCRILCLAGVTYEQQKQMQAEDGDGEPPMQGMDPGAMPPPEPEAQPLNETVDAALNEAPPPTTGDAS
jgi:hypothetical protein